MATTSTATHAPEAAQSVGDVPSPRYRRRTPVWVSQCVLRATTMVTGMIVALSVVVHVVGNLKVLMGLHVFNGYTAQPRQVAYPLLPHEGLLWVTRLTLGVCVVAHVAMGITLWRWVRNACGTFRRRALPARTIGVRSTLAIGVPIEVFVLLHALDLIVGRLTVPKNFQAPTTSNGKLRASAYHNLVASLSRPGMALFYSLVMLTLLLHLAQGLWNVVIGLGGTGPRLRKTRHALALDVVLAVAVANGLLPILICTGVIG